MAVNYFNESSTPSGRKTDDIIDEIEYRVVSNKISKLSSSVGSRIVESTASGDIKESEVGVEILTEQLNTLKTCAEASETSVETGVESLTEQLNTLKTRVESLTEQLNTLKMHVEANAALFSRNFELISRDINTLGTLHQ